MLIDRRRATTARRWCALALAALAALAALTGCSPDRPPALALTTVRVLASDDPRWAQPDADDRHAPRVPITGVRPPAPVWWLRGTLTVDATWAARSAPLALAVAALASCEVYWDGVRLGANGTVGPSARAERPGLLVWRVVVPAPVVVGDHAVSLRCSAHHRGFDPQVGFYGVWLGDAAELTQAAGGDVALTLVCAGALLTVGLFHLVRFGLARAGRRRRSRDGRDADLGLGVLGLAAGAMVIAESVKAFVDYPYDLHVVRLRVLAALAWLVSVGLVGFVTARYPRSGRRIAWLVAAGGATLALGADGYDAKVASVLGVGLVVALAWTGLAVIARRWDAGLAAVPLLGGLIGAVAAPTAFIDYYLFFLLCGLCLAMLLAHAVGEARAREVHEATALENARLEIELLRRQLAPHFLLNTLAALGEWFETEPKVASAMLEALGQELRLLSDLSARTEVAMADELALCRCHLAVMAHRRDEVLSLDADGVDPAAMVPPALFHTLIENALSHNRYGAAGAAFRLRQDRGPAPRGTRYAFDAPLAPAGRVRADGGGVGLRYVHARLRERYGDDYRVTSSAVDIDGAARWRTVIELPAQPPRTP